MREELVKKYAEKYSVDVVDTENSLESYNGFYKNMGFGDSIEKLIEKKLEEKVFVRVMDLGCGNGGFLEDLKKQFQESIHTIGVDLLTAEKKPDEMIMGDALSSKFPKNLDFVFSFKTLHEIGEPEKIVEKVYASLADKGKAFLSFRTMDLYSKGKGIAELGEKEVKQLQKMVRSRKLSGFSVTGFEVSVKDEKGKSSTAGINIFLEK
ncbi:class I SAM-dependent methyltransferase [archaeon]|nr:class I SAM-dependent methyltransferase [archaeon]